MNARMQDTCTDTASVQAIEGLPLCCLQAATAIGIYIPHWCKNFFWCRYSIDMLFLWYYRAIKSYSVLCTQYFHAAWILYA